ncbi:hypothetical protein E4U40_003549 [Claviceps sp. LM458 group G5]|nr:hypothetical protein E4U40_003549 [Claviceps sp. LM458 group G5]
MASDATHTNRASRRHTFKVMEDRLQQSEAAREQQSAQLQELNQVIQQFMSNNRWLRSERDDLRSVASGPAAAPASVGHKFRFGPSSGRQGKEKVPT